MLIVRLIGAVVGLIAVTVFVAGPLLDDNPYRGDAMTTLIGYTKDDPETLVPNGKIVDLLETRPWDCQGRYDNGTCRRVMAIEKIDGTTYRITKVEADKPYVYKRDDLQWVKIQTQAEYALGDFGLCADLADLRRSLTLVEGDAESGELALESKRKSFWRQENVATLHCYLFQSAEAPDDAGTIKAILRDGLVKDGFLVKTRLVAVSTSKIRSEFQSTKPTFSPHFLKLNTE